MGLFHMIGEAWDRTWNTQMKEYYVGQGLSNSCLAVPGTRINHGLLSNNHEMLTTGSIFDVTAGQAALVLFNGRIHDCVVAMTDKEAGQFRFEEESAPSIFAGGLSAFIPVVKLAAERIGMSSGVNNNASISYVNIRPVVNNTLEFHNIPFKETDIGLTVIASGAINFSFQIVNPITFFENCINDITKPFDLAQGDGAELLTALRTEVLTSIQSIVGGLFGQGVEYYQMNQYNRDIAQRLNRMLYDSWITARGIAIRNINLNITLDEESRSRLFKYQEARIVGNNPTIAKGRLINAYAAALENPNNAMGTILAMGLGNSYTSTIAQSLQSQPNQRVLPPVIEGSPDTTDRFIPHSQADQTLESVHVVTKCSNCGWRPSNVNNAPSVCPLCGAKLR